MYKVRGFFQSEEQEERVLEALLMFIFLWEPYKPLTGGEQALFPFLPVALIVDWEYCNTQFTAVSGLESFVWDPAVSPPASLSPSRLLGFRDFVSLLQVTRKLAWCLQVGRVISWRFFASHPVGGKIIVENFLGPQWLCRCLLFLLLGSSLLSLPLLHAFVLVLLYSAFHISQVIVVGLLPPPSGQSWFPAQVLNG